MSKLFSVVFTWILFLSSLLLYAPLSFAQTLEPPKMSVEFTQTNITVRWDQPAEENVDAVVELEGGGYTREITRYIPEKPTITEHTFDNLAPGGHYTVWVKYVKNIEVESERIDGGFSAWEVTLPTDEEKGQAVERAPDQQDTAFNDLGGPPAGIEYLETLIKRMISLIVPLAFGAVTIMLVWAGIRFITSGGDAKAISSASLIVTWALLGLLFLILAWLILKLVAAFTGVSSLTTFCLGFNCN